MRHYIKCFLVGACVSAMAGATGLEAYSVNWFVFTLSAGLALVLTGNLLEVK